jgi:hypothetical protein
MRIELTVAEFIKYPPIIRLCGEENMARRIPTCLGVSFLVLFAAARPGAASQLGYSDADRTGWVDFLRTAKIADAVQMGGPNATTSPWKLTLTKGDLTHFGLWKDVDRGAAEGGPDRWRYEIAAYELDVLLGLGMVPPNVERSFQGRRGSLQLWRDGLTLKDRMAKGPDIPAVGGEEWNRKAFLQRAFDSLIANDDRNLNNILLGNDDKMMILIDHSRTFRTAEPFLTKLVYGAAGLARTGDGTPYPFSRLPRIFVDRLRALTAKSVKDAVKSHLNGKEIDALLSRRDLILKEIDDHIRRDGESAVLY